MKNRKKFVVETLAAEPAVEDATIIPDIPGMGRPATRIVLRYRSAVPHNDTGLFHLNEVTRVVKRNLEQCDTVIYKRHTTASPRIQVGPDGETHTFENIGPIYSIRASSLAGGALIVDAIIS